MIHLIKRYPSHPIGRTDPLLYTCWLTWNLEWLLPEIFANKHAARIISCILGPQPEVHFLRSNTLLNNDDRQRVHSDMRFEHPSHPFAITQNVCLCDCGPENGITELWLGT